MSHVKESVIKSRKAHRCEWCGELIAKGSEYVLLEWVDEDFHGRVRRHTECHLAMKQLDRYFDWEDPSLFGCNSRGHNHETGWDHPAYLMDECPGCAAICAGVGGGMSKEEWDRIHWERAPHEKS